MIIDGMVSSSGQITSETDLTNGVDLKLNSLTNDNNDMSKMRNIPLTKTSETEERREVENIETAAENLRKNIKTLRKNVPEQRTFHEEGAQGVWNLPAVSQVGLKYNPCAEDYAVGEWKNFWTSDKYHEQNSEISSAFFDKIQFFFFL